MYLIGIVKNLTTEIVEKKTTTETNYNPNTANMSVMIHDIVGGIGSSFFEATEERRQDFATMDISTASHCRLSLFFKSIKELQQFQSDVLIATNKLINTWSLKEKAQEIVKHV